LISIAEFFDNVSDLEHVFQDKYKKWLILGSNHEAIYGCFSLEPDADDLDFGLGVAVAIRGATPKALLVENYQTVYVGFDTYIAAVSLTQPSSKIESQLFRLDGVFFDLSLLGNGTLCIIHEIGVQVFTGDLTNIWSFSKDIISDWAINEERGILSLTLTDTGEVINLSISTGAILPN